LEDEFAVLIQGDGADRGDTRFAPLLHFPFKNLRQRAQGIEAIDGLHEADIIISEIGDRLLRVVLNAKRKGDVHHHQGRND
jgi:hypothetical protein